MKAHAGGWGYTQRPLLWSEQNGSDERLITEYGHSNRDSDSQTRKYICIQ